MTIATVLGNKGSDVETIAASATVGEVIERLGAKRIGALPVLDGRAVSGIISERDIIYCLRDHGAEVLEWTVERIMTQPAVTIDQTMGIEEAMELMTRRRIRHLPVVENNELIGIVSIGDLVKDKIERVEAEAEAMRDYIRTA